jgi:uncharacterized protein (DUF1778 family)
MQRAEYTIVLPFRVTPSQRDLLRQLAAQRGTTVSELIRAAVLPNVNTVNAQRDGAALPAK